MLQKFILIFWWKREGTRFNPKIIKSIVQGVLIFITKNMVVEMLHLPKLGITKLLTKPTKEKDKEKE